MTDIDPESDIELHTVSEHVMVRVPLAGRVTGEWLRRYQRLARATGCPCKPWRIPAGPGLSSACQSAVTSAK